MVLVPKLVLFPNTFHAFKTQNTIASEIIGSLLSQGLYMRHLS